MKPISSFAFLIYASLAAASGGAPPYQALLEKELGPDAARRPAVTALLAETVSADAALAGERESLAAEHARLVGAVYAKLSALLGPEQRPAVDPAGPAHAVDSDHLPPLGEDAVRRGREAHAQAEPRLRELSVAISGLLTRERALWEGFYRRLPAAAGHPGRRKAAAAREAITAARDARQVRDALVRLAGDEAALGPALERVRRAEAVKAGVVAPWRRSWLAQDAESFGRLLTQDFRGTELSGFGRVGKDAPLTRETLASRGLGREAALADARAFLGEHATVEGVDLDILGVEPAPGGGHTFKGLLSVRGLSRDGGRRMETRASARLTIKDGLIAGLELSSLERISAVPGSLFTEETVKSGLAAVPVRLRSESIRRGGYALAVRDDGETPAELYVGSVEGSSLLRRGEDGRFSESSARSGLGDDRLVKAAVFADFDGDGIDDLLVNHFQSDPRKALALYAGRGDGRYRKARGFDFTRIARDFYKYPMTMSAADFDGDSRLDLFVGFPGTMDFTTMRFEEAPDTAAGPRPQGLFLNKGGFDFADATEYGLYAEKGARTLAYPHSSVASDLDMDGRPDLIVVDDRKNPSTIYHNKGNGVFEERSRELGVWHAHWGMSAALGDPKNGGSQDLYLTNVNFTASYVMEDHAGFLFGKGDTRTNGLGNHLYRNRGDGTYEDVTDAAGVRFAGAGAAGALFFDFDNDGHQDLYVANGLWSAGPQAESFDATFALAAMAEHNVWIMGKMFGLKGFGHASCRNCATGALMGGEDIRRNAVLRMLRDLRDEQGRPALSLGGDQRNRLFRNNGDGTFTDVAYAAGVDSSADGYVAAVAELERDGALHLLLRNGDPGVAEHSYPTVQMFRNRAARANKHLSLRLKGKASGRDAVGTKAFVERAGGARQYRELIANNGAAQDAKLLHFGLGSDESADLRVLWPSGLEQRFPALAPGSYALEEGGRPVAAEPLARVASARE